MTVVWYTIAAYLAVTAYLERNEHDPIYQLFTALVIVICTEGARIRKEVRRGKR